MKRALLLTYYVPPRRAIASVRAGQLMTSLPRHGWDVVAVTPDFGDTKYDDSVRTTGVIDFKAPMRRLLGVGRNATRHEGPGFEDAAMPRAPSMKQRAIRLGYDVTEFANRRFGWISHGTPAINEMLQRERFDAVISTSPPETTHMVAARVHGVVPWVGDLRDPWRRENQLFGPRAFSLLDQALEPRAFRSASALTTVSEPLAATLRERYPGKPVHSIPNAFSAEEWAGVPFRRPSRATFMYAGQLYSGKRDPKPLFEAFAHLLAERLVSHDEIQIDFYGEPQVWLDGQIAQFGLRRCAKQHGAIGRAEIFEKERAATRLLMFLWDNPSERGTYTGKLFEYLGARRKVIACGGPETSVVDEVFRATKAGVRSRSALGLRDAILDAVRVWRTGTDEVVTEDAVAPYESSLLASRFAEILETCTAASLH